MASACSWGGGGGGGGSARAAREVGSGTEALAAQPAARACGQQVGPRSRGQGTGWPSGLHGASSTRPPCAARLCLYEGPASAFGPPGVVSCLARAGGHGPWRLGLEEVAEEGAALAPARRVLGAAVTELGVVTSHVHGHFLLPGSRWLGQSEPGRGAGQEPREGRRRAASPAQPEPHPRAARRAALQATRSLRRCEARPPASRTAAAPGAPGGAPASETGGRVLPAWFLPHSVFPPLDLGWATSNERASPVHGASAQAPAPPAAWPAQGSLVRRLPPPGFSDGVPAPRLCVLRSGPDERLVSRFWCDCLVRPRAPSALQWPGRPSSLS